MQAFTSVILLALLAASAHAVPNSVTYESQTYNLWTPSDGDLNVGDQLIVQMQYTMCSGGGACCNHVDILRATNQQLWCGSNHQQNFNGPYAFLQPVSGAPGSSNPNNDGANIAADSVIRVATAVNGVYQFVVPSTSTTVDFYSQSVGGGQTPYFQFANADASGLVFFRSAEAISVGQEGAATGYIAYDDGCRLKVDYDRSPPCHRFAVFRLPAQPVSSCNSANCVSHAVACDTTATSFTSTTDCATLSFSC